MDELYRFCDLVGPNGEFPVDVVCFANDSIDHRVYQIGFNDIHGLSSLLASLMPGQFDCITVPVDKTGCPAVRMFLQGWRSTTCTNFGFASFLAKLDITHISPRCRTAVVVGVNDDILCHDVFAPLPLECYMGIPVIPVGIDGRVDLLCDTPIAGKSVSALRAILRGVAGPPTWPLSVKCQACSKSRGVCDYLVGCARCKRTGGTCIPSEPEWTIRAKNLSTCISSNLVRHHHHAKYILHTQAVCNQNSVLSASDISGVRAAVTPREAYPSIAADGPFPREIIDLLRTSDCYKLEWMDNGKYVAKLSDVYEKHIISLADIKAVSRKLKCAPKIVDTLNFGRVEQGYEMWTKSLDYHNCVVEYTGYVYWKGVGVVETRVKMLSVRFNSVGVLTATVVYQTRLRGEEDKNQKGDDQF